MQSVVYFLPTWFLCMCVWACSQWFLVPAPSETRVCSSKKDQHVSASVPITHFSQPGPGMGHTGSIATTAGLFCPCCHATEDSAVLWHLYLSTISTRTLREATSMHTPSVFFLIIEHFFCQVYGFISGLLHSCAVCWLRFSRADVGHTFLSLDFVKFLKVGYFFMAVSCASGLLKRKWCLPGSTRSHVPCSSEPKAHTHTHMYNKQTFSPTEDKYLFYIVVCLLV